MQNIQIVNPEKIEQIKKNIIKDGADNLHIIADFDRTLTNSFVKGKKRPSIISLLRDGDYLTVDYRQKSHELFDKYHPMENDTRIDLEKRKKLMNQWWMEHFDLLIKSGLDKKDLEKISQSENLEMREGAMDFFKMIDQKKIPLVIMSASGVGDSIGMFLEKNGYMNSSVYVISNLYEWDESGKAIAVKQPIIHTLNKGETSIKNYPIFEKIKNRKNVILMGDSLGDADMTENVDHDNIIKIGFLNEKIEENLEEYKKVFDVVILNDGNLDYVNELIKSI